MELWEAGMLSQGWPFCLTFCAQIGMAPGLLAWEA
jgi:hypothetical protein